MFGRKPRPEQFVDREQARLSFLQTEYTAIRTELVAAVTTQQTVMSYGRNRWRTNLHSRPAYHLASGLLGGTGLGTTVLSVVLALVTNLPVPLRWLAAGGAVLFGLLCGYGFLLTRRNSLLKQNGHAIP